MPKGSQSLPNEVVEVLGRTALGSRQHAHLVRCGNKLLLVSLTATGAETLTEITDPVEVDRLSGLCRQSQPHSATATFRNIFQQFGRDRTARGFLSSPERESAASLADALDETLDGSTEEFHA
jgi:flagellar biogenesis protein FliO